MSAIHVSIIGTHHLLCEGIESLFSQTPDIDVISKHTTCSDFLNTNIESPIHIVIKNLYNITNQDIIDVEEILKQHPKIKILIISFSEDEKTIFQIIRAGAKGFLAHDAVRHDLYEAVYSLRNGFDYFSKCITTILLNRYISSIQKNESSESNELDKLSIREIEILKLWGDSKTNQEIAETLFISVRTVESHKTHIMQRLNLKTAVDLMKYAIKNNIIQID